MYSMWRFINIDTSMVNVSVVELTDEELHQIKDLISTEISKRHKAKMEPKKRKCSECEYYRLNLDKEEAKKHHKWPCHTDFLTGPFCFCGHPHGKLIPNGHTTPSWCKKGKD